MPCGHCAAPGNATVNAGTLDEENGGSKRTIWFEPQAAMKRLPFWSNASCAGWLTPLIWNAGAVAESNGGAYTEIVPDSASATYSAPALSITTELTNVGFGRSAGIT